MRLKFEKSRAWMKTIINIIYAVLFSGVLVGTLMIDKHNEQNSFQNKVPWANGGYYLIALILLAAICCLYVRRGQKRYSGERSFRIAVAVIFVFVLFLQTFVAKWVPIMDQPNDFGEVHNMAIRLANGGQFLGDEYFSVHYNNANLTILLSWVYGIFRSWRAIIMIGAVLTNLSVVIMTFIIRKLTHNPYVAIIMCVIAEIMAALSLRAFYPYTDNWAMPLIIGMIAAFVSDIRPVFKAPLVLLLGMAGTWIKITAAIPLLAICFYCVLTGDVFRSVKDFFNKSGSKKRKAARKSRLLTLALCLAVLLGGFVMSTALKMRYPIELSDDARGWQFMFMVGQAYENSGQSGGTEYEAVWEEIMQKYPDRKNRLDECRRQGMNWVKERGIIGGIGFYLKKLNVAYNDGYFHNIQPYDHDTVKPGIVREIYDNRGAYVIIVGELKQVLWDFSLICLAFPIILNLLRLKRKNICLFFEMSIIGVILYMFLFEGRSKYLYMFLPLYFSFAGIMLDQILKEVSLIHTCMKDYRNRITDDLQRSRQKRMRQQRQTAEDGKMER